MKLEKYVTLWHWDDNEKQAIFGQVFLTDEGEVRFAGFPDNGFVAESMQVIYGKLAKRFTPDDGLDYMENLQYNFSGSRLWAGKVQDL